MEKLLQRLLKKGSLSIGILSGEAGKTHEPKDEKAQTLSAFAGFEDSAGKVVPATITIGEIAEIHEFGLGSCPRRSFLQDWADESKDRIRQVVRAGAEALVRGDLDSPLQFLNQFGAWGVGQVQKRMASNIPPPLAPETIRRKGSSVALIDTGQLRSSVSYRVETAVALKGGASFGQGPETPGIEGLEVSTGGTP